MRSSATPPPHSDLELRGSGDEVAGCGIGFLIAAFTAAIGADAVASAPLQRVGGAAAS